MGLSCCQRTTPPAWAGQGPRQQPPDARPPVWCPQAERYEEMVEEMKKVAKMVHDQELSVEERNLLSVAYKNVIGARRASWRIVSSIEQKEESKGNEEHVSRIKAYRQVVSSRLRAPGARGAACAAQGVGCRGWFCRGPALIPHPHPPWPPCRSRRSSATFAAASCSSWTST